MTDEQLPDDGIRISIEIGPAYDVSDRLAGLLRDLHDEISDAEVAGYAFDFDLLGTKPTSSEYFTHTLTNFDTRLDYTENDSKGKKKGNVEYG